MSTGISTGEAARALGVCPATVVNYIRKGRLQATRNPLSGRYRVDAGSVMKLCRDKEVRNIEGNER